MADLENTPDTNDSRPLNERSGAWTIPTPDNQEVKKVDLTTDATRAEMISKKREMHDNARALYNSTEDSKTHDDSHDLPPDEKQPVQMLNRDDFRQKEEKADTTTEPVYGPHGLRIDPLKDTQVVDSKNNPFAARNNPPSESKVRADEKHDEQRQQAMNAYTQYEMNKKAQVIPQSEVTQEIPIDQLRQRLKEEQMTAGQASTSTQAEVAAPPKSVKEKLLSFLRRR